MPGGLGYRYLGNYKKIVQHNYFLDQQHFGLLCGWKVVFPARFPGNVTAAFSGSGLPVIFISS